MNAKDQYVSRCQEILNLWGELKTRNGKDMAAVEEYAKRIAEMCRNLQSFYVENEPALQSVRGIEDWSRIIQEEARRIEEKLEEANGDFRECLSVLEEDIEALFTGAIACIDRQK